MEHGRVEALWKLSRRFLPKEYFLGKADGKLLQMPQSPGLDLPLLFTDGNGTVKMFQSHSKRSAWLFQPWRDEQGRWYPGYEYKGVGLEGGPIEVLQDGTLWGAQPFAWATQEYETTKAVWKLLVGEDSEPNQNTNCSPVPAVRARQDTTNSSPAARARYDTGLCQRPVGLYAMDLEGRRIGVMVRAVQSPIRLHDFWYYEWLMDAYLEITGEKKEEYARRLGTALGNSVRMMSDAGYCKPLEIDNITSEGEHVDFEHVWDGEWSGDAARLRSRPAVLHHALNNLLKEIPFVLGGTSLAAFEKAFGAAFAGIVVDDGDPSASAKKLLEAYIGRGLSAEELKLMPPPGVKAKLEADRKRKLESVDRLKASLPQIEAAYREGKVSEDDWKFIKKNLESLGRDVLASSWE
jgi:hypothetical protein